MEENFTSVSADATTIVNNKLVAIPINAILSSDNDFVVYIDGKLTTHRCKDYAAACEFVRGFIVGVLQLTFKFDRVID